MKNKLYILAGPTAVGKTALSIELAKRNDLEIISADSMQVYKRLDIGSAKIRPEEMQGVRHYLIDVLEPSENFNVARFQEMAKEAMNEIYSHNKTPLVVGGTGFYTQALLYDIDFSENEVDEKLRAEIDNEARERGADHLHSRLKELDAESAEAIPPGNVKRVARALEYCLSTGEKFSEHNKREREKESPYDFRYFVLNMPRDILYQRIEKRVDIMMETGLLEEVQNCMNEGLKRDMNSMQGLGYKQLLKYLYGECSLETAVDDIKKETRHFAKRQLTWFRREKNVIFIDKEKFASDEEILAYMERCMMSSKDN
ncbi:tRNA (adenosine(37)-N6)-dimethylallyltransferase MiaA [Lachnospiraceae bacterium C1.1]|nr:tRNA (adenosine(37)-N6)-dimethylallyltransferase MiaA [Lachnospiraceae bacterium C1.1]